MNNIFLTFHYFFFLRSKVKKITGDKKQAAQQRQKNAQQVRKQQRAQQLAKRRQIDVKASKPKKRMLFKC